MNGTLSPEAQARYETAIAHLPDYVDTETGKPTGEREERIAQCIKQGILPADFKLDPAEVKKAKKRIDRRIDQGEV